MTTDSGRQGDFILPSATDLLDRREFYAVKIYFARHGQTDWNIQGKAQGATDIPLNETGIAQARQLCEELEKRGIAVRKVYSSYQQRAAKTAQIVAGHFGTDYETVDGLQEMCLGDFEGHTWDEIRSLFPKELEYWNEDRRYHRSPNGESYQMVLERLFKALGHILAQHDTSSDENLLIISHGAVILTLIAMQQEPPFSSYRISVENAVPVEFGITELEEIRAKLQIRESGQTGQLNSN
jgi:probable phosphoglycerate mutase